MIANLISTTNSKFEKYVVDEDKKVIGYLELQERKSFRFISGYLANIQRWNAGVMLSSLVYSFSVTGDIVTVNTANSKYVFKILEE